ncbi:MULTISPECIES: DUF3800 domain-containing protein [Clostridium]|mgnify:CR=1 FL=1|uniref:DUF3800 domain-containing protein n=1 Tax=Clostridium TaxID=1485 RepID=UPI0032EF9B11
MNLYIYSDESGVFDKVHNDIYVYGGVLFLSKEDKDINVRKYKNVERVIRESKKYDNGVELKACILGNKEKSKIYRSLNKCIKFGVIVNQKNIRNEIFVNKKSKQRYLDYAYKIGLKRMFENLICEGIISADEIENIYIYIDEHTTATDGRYELKESLEQEFKIGTFNYDYNKFYPPIFKNLKSVNVKYCNSNSVTLVRASDIVANNIYYKAIRDIENKSNKLYLTILP